MRAAHREDADRRQTGPPDAGLMRVMHQPAIRDWM
jgi:hypothetical protein